MMYIDTLVLFFDFDFLILIFFFLDFLVFGVGCVCHKKKNLEKFEMKNWNLNYTSVETSQTFIECHNRY